MTRNDFLENVTTFDDLRVFCDNAGCGLLEEVYDEESRDDYINSCLMDWAREDSWQDLFSRLNNVPTDYDWYCLDDYGEWRGLDDSDFDGYKEDVLRWGDYTGVWDEGEGEEEEDHDVFEEELARDAGDEEPAPEDEDFSVGDLVGMCFTAFATIQDNAAKRAEEEEQKLQRLYPKILK